MQYSSNTKMNISLTRSCQESSSWFSRDSIVRY